MIATATSEEMFLQLLQLICKEAFYHLFISSIHEIRVRYPLIIRAMFLYNHVTRHIFGHDPNLSTVFCYLI